MRKLAIALACTIAATTIAITTAIGPASANFPANGYRVTAGGNFGGIAGTGGIAEPTVVRIAITNNVLTADADGAPLYADSGCTQITAQQVECPYTHNAFSFAATGIIDFAMTSADRPISLVFGGPEHPSNHIDASNFRLAPGSNYAASIQAGGTIIGTPEFDRFLIYGPATVYAGDGDDLGNINAAGDTVTFYGQGGDDQILYGNGQIYIDGGPGDDRIEIFSHQVPYNEGADTLLGGEGNDRINISDAPQGSTIDGGPGNDYIAGRLRGGTITGGTGTDELILVSPVIISIDSTANDVGPTGSGDVANIGAGFEIIHTGDGDDVVLGSSAAETFETGGGNDRIDPGGGADTVRAGDGNDQVSVADLSADIVDCGNGTDTVQKDLFDTNITNCETQTGAPIFGLLGLQTIIALLLALLGLG